MEPSAFKDKAGLNLVVMFSFFCFVTLNNDEEIYNVAQNIVLQFQYCANVWEA